MALTAYDIFHAGAPPRKFARMSVILNRWLAAIYALFDSAILIVDRDRTPVAGSIVVIVIAAALLFEVPVAR